MFRKIQLALAGVSLLLLPLIYSEGLANLLHRWLSEEEYSHGILIPVLSLYLAWERRDALRAAVGPGSGWGLTIILFALILTLVGEISAYYLLIHYSFVFYLFGWAVVLWGRPVGRLLFMPLVILLFAVPLPYFIQAIVTSKMQLLSSELGVVLIRLFDIPVYLSGNVIDLGSVQLEVVEACSGLRYLFPLMSIGFLTAYFYQAALWKRCFVFISTIPITIVMNSLRIGLTAVLVDHYGPAMAEGFVHDFEGWAVFALCLAVLLGQILLLERFTTRRSVLEVIGLGEIKPIVPGPAQPVRRIHLLLCTAGLVGTVFTVLALDQMQRRGEVHLSPTNLALFPSEVQQWHGQFVYMGDQVLEALKVTDHLMRNYTHPQYEEPVNLYVAYYGNQRKGESPHSPRVCIPGGGWSITDLSRTELDGRPLNRVLISREGESQLVYYWFSERGQVVANEYVKKWLLLRDFLMTGRSDGALIRVTTPIPPGGDMAAADRRLQEFVRSMNEPLMSYLPEATLYE